MESEHGHGVDRFVTFADAVVAIAITLLAIPLLEIADTATEGLAEWWSASALPLLGLTVSFAVIARLWWANHRVLAHVVRWSTPMLVVTFVWLFTIVLVSVATAVTTRVDPTEDGGSWAFAIYVCVVIASGLTLFIQCLIVYRDPGLTDGHDDGALRRVLNSGETVVGFLLTLVVGLAFPAVNYLAFFSMIVTGRLMTLLRPRLERRLRERRSA